MTYGDLLDTLVQKAGDTTTAFRTNAYRWLNLVRQEAAIRGTFNTAHQFSGVTTEAGVSHYPIANIDAVSGSELQNITSDSILTHASEDVIRRMDPGAGNSNTDDEGEPTHWNAIAVHATGSALLHLWPTPDAEYTLNWIAYKTVTDITQAQETLTLDPYFGRLSQFAPMLMAGLNWQYAIYDEQDLAEIVRAERRFDDLIKITAGHSPADNQAPSRLEPVNRRGGRPAMGRFSSHFDNR